MMLFTAIVTVLATAVPLAAATPSQKYYGCDVSRASLGLPSTGAISVPSGVKPIYITLGNYTCTSAGSYTSAGAVAKLVDISCLYAYDEKAFNGIQDRVYGIFPANSQQVPSWKKIESVLGSYSYISGDHYFIAQGEGIAPMFDFRAESKKGNPNAYSVAKRVGGIPSPDGSKNVDWLQLESTAGKLAKYIFRVDTRAGVAPASCNQGSQITVPYVAKYFSSPIPVSGNPTRIMMFLTAVGLTLASVLSLASAAPARKYYGCDVSDALLDLPSTNVINIPSDAKPVYITLGVGTQNYTCTSAGNYTSAGAVAKLIDISCLYEYDEKAFDDIQDSVYNLIPMYSHQLPSSHKIEALLKHYPRILGDHYFTKQNASIALVFDFRARSRRGDEHAFTIDKRVGGIPSPDGKKNIDWLQLESTAGQLAKYTFRVDTKGGVAPPSCHKEGHTIKVPYVAKYWFYN